MSNIYLILGGNGFIGSEVVYNLVLTDPKCCLLLLNRGNWSDWDTKTRIKPFTTNIIWNRETDSICEALNDYLKDDQFKFEAVIDFSAYKKQDVKNVLKELSPDRFKNYILISSDSVYEVSVPKHGDPDRHFVEADSIRPSSIQEIKKLKSLDSYGHHKLKCEEYLIERSNQTGLKYLILRVADVIGPRDSTERFWFHQIWLDYLSSFGSQNNLLVIIPDKYFELKTSYTFVKDIAQCINLLMNKSIHNEVFNLSCSYGTVTLVDLLKLIADAVQTGLGERLNFVRGSDDDQGFPSVMRNGGISSEKLMEKTGFKSVDLNEAVKETVEFYKMGYKQFPKEAQRVAKAVKKSIFKGRLNSDEVIKFDEFLNSRMK